jgi:hypothetical protein
MNVQPVDLYIYNPSIVSVQYTINPIAGLTILVRCALVILGAGKLPLEVPKVLNIEELMLNSPPPAQTFKLALAFTP